MLSDTHGYDIQTRIMVRFWRSHYDGQRILRNKTVNRFWGLFDSLAAFNSDDQRFLSLTSMQSPRGMPNRRPLTGVQSLPQILI